MNAVCGVTVEQGRQQSRDSSVSPPPTAVQCQQPQSSALTHVTAAEQVEQVETTTSDDAPPGSDAGICVSVSFICCE